MGRRQHVINFFSLLFVDIEKLHIKISSLFHQKQILILQESHLKTLPLPLHWKISRLIIKYENQRIRRDEDPQDLLSQLSKNLIKKFRKRCGPLILEEGCKFCFVYPLSSKKNVLNKSADISQFHSPFTWDHNRLLIHVGCLKTRKFYKKNTVLVTVPFFYLNNLLKIVCLKNFPPTSIKKVCCGLLNKEAWLVHRK